MSQTQTDSQKFSGTERGEMYVSKFQTYLANLSSTGQTIPLDTLGQPIITELSKDSGIPRNSFYTNKGVKKLLGDYMGVVAESSATSGITEHYQEQLELRNRRILKLEQRMANVEAENEELRKRLVEAEQNLLRYKVIEDDVIKIGRRIIP